METATAMAAAGTANKLKDSDKEKGPDKGPFLFGGLRQILTASTPFVTS